ALPVSAFFFSSRRRHTRCYRDWSSDVCSSDLLTAELQCYLAGVQPLGGRRICPPTKRRRALSRYQSLPLRLCFRARRMGRSTASRKRPRLILPPACQSSSVGENESLSRYVGAANKPPHMRNRNMARFNRLGEA